MKRYFAGMTDTGNVRNVNQDAYYIDPDGRFLLSPMAWVDTQAARKPV